jgi:hypothetical protein
LSDEYTIRNKALYQFDKDHPKPKWQPPTLEAASVITHSSGRIWFEVGGEDYPDRGSYGDLHITFGSDAKSATVRLDQLALAMDEIVRVINEVGLVNAAKDKHLEAARLWEENKVKAAEQAVKEWRSQQRADKKAAKTSEQ